MQNKSVLGKLSVLSFSLALAALGGCASTSDLAAVKKTADDALAAANAAQSSANAAASKADAASQAASAAGQKADQAQATADKALAESQSTNEKLDRMFKKGMAK